MKTVRFVEKPKTVEKDEIQGEREREQMLDLLIHVASSVTEYQTNSQGHLGMDHPLRTIVLTTQG